MDVWIQATMYETRGERDVESSMLRIYLELMGKGKIDSYLT